MKNFFIIIILLIIQIKVSAQTTIKVILKTNLKIDSVDAFDLSQLEYHSYQYKDTLVFKFDKHNIDDYNIRYFSNGKRYWTQIWLDTGVTIINAHTDTKLVIDTVINSPVYYDVLNYYKTNSKFYIAKDTAALNKYLLAQVAKNLENPRSIAIAMDYIRINQNSKPELLKLRNLLNEQKTDFSWFLLYKLGIGRMNNILATKTIDLTGYDFLNRQNKEVKLISNNNADYYILDFWFLGCAPCMAQHKQIKANYLKLKNANVGVIGISIDKDFKRWNKYLSENAYDWDNYLQTGDHKLSDFLSIDGFPTYVVINKSGNIIGTYSDIDSLFQSLKITLQ